MLTFPNIDPIAIQIGALAIRWYALAYIAGILGGYFLACKLAVRQQSSITKKHLEDLLFWVMLGIVIGGRAGYVLLYQWGYYSQHPLEVLHLWQGGMAFHGGLFGVIIAALFFCRRYKIPALALGDLLACSAPLGLFFGRLANFINGELYGRVTDSPLGMIFPNGGNMTRHPSQLYEAALEGIGLLILLNILAWCTPLLHRRGILTGLFLLGYALCRIVVEYFREPDAQIGLYLGGISQGQLLSLPMLVAGVCCIFLAVKKK